MAETVFDDDAQVRHQRPVLDIAAFKCGPASVGAILTPARTRTDQAWAQSPIEIRGIPAHLRFTWREWASPDNAHIAAENVDDPRQLVETKLHKNRPDGRKVRLVYERQMARPCGSSLRAVHGLAGGAELQATEHTPASPDAWMSLKGGTPISNHDKNADQQEQRAEKDENQ
jgi:hypothetical protein